MELHDVEFIYDNLNDTQVDEFRALQKSYEMGILQILFKKANLEN